MTSAYRWAARWVRSPSVLICGRPVERCTSDTLATGVVRVRVMRQVNSRPRPKMARCWRCWRCSDAHLSHSEHLRAVTDVPAGAVHGVSERQRVGQQTQGSLWPMSWQSAALSMCRCACSQIVRGVLSGSKTDKQCGQL
jgi:hypothetical protein